MHNAHQMIIVSTTHNAVGNYSLAAARYYIINVIRYKNSN